MNRIKKTVSRRAQRKAVLLFRLCLLSGVFGAGVPFHAMASDVYSYDVSADIETGTCTPDVTPASLVLPSVDPSELALGGVHSQSKIQVTFACGGSGKAGMMPTLNIAGTAIQSSTGTDGNYLFRDATSAVSGVGFVLSKKNTGLWDTQDFYKVNADVPLMSQPGSAYDGSTLDMFAGVACGGEDTCEADYDGGAVTTGDVSATLTFTFAYK